MTQLETKMTPVSPSTHISCWVAQVVHGDETMVSKNPKHTLLLVYPGPDDMAHNALAQYKGRTLLYVGKLALRVCEMF